jgi:hypothetical protein
VLTESHGSWSNAPTSYTYQWTDCTATACEAITGATDQTYTLTRFDAGMKIQVTELAHNAGGVGMASSAPTAALPGQFAVPANTSPPGVDGAPNVGSGLMASLGVWSSHWGISSYAYKWQRCTPQCTDIPGAGGAFSTAMFIGGIPGMGGYRLTLADEGAYLRTVITASSWVGDGQATSAELGPVAPSVDVLKASLLRTLLPSGGGARIRTLLKRGGYRFQFSAPCSGILAISWRHQPRDPYSAPTLIAWGWANLHAGNGQVKIILTADGRDLLKRASRLTVTADGSFGPSIASAANATLRFTLRK